MRTNIGRKQWFAVILNVFVLRGLLNATAQDRPPKAPDALNLPDARALLLKARGEGVQIYECKVPPDAAGQFKWVLKAPQADLINDKGEKIGKHYGGPTWESSDGSKVIGEPQQHVDSPNASAIQWLLLKAKSNQGTGIFKDVTYIQRLDTEGGKAPTVGCDSGHTGAEVRVHYSASYYFYGPKTTTP
ncbi:MAG: hypothetical protein JWO91_1195 [Acidobacteriaceae bacterium]|nr:hypothetical protein [Acidobacteriaceae bacterium]